MNSNPLPALKPLLMKDRVSMVFIKYGQVDVMDGAFVVIDTTGVRTHVPRVSGDEPQGRHALPRALACSPR